MKKIVLMPSIWLKPLYDPEKGVAVLRKIQRVEYGGCGLRHRIYGVLPVPITGGYRLFLPDDDSLKVAFEIIKDVVSEEYAKSEIETIDMLRIVGKTGIVYKDKKGRTYALGFFPFEWLEDRFRPSKEEPTHWYKAFHTSCRSRTWSSRAKILNPDAHDYVYHTGTSCALEDESLAIVIAEFGTPIKVELSKQRCPYRGGVAEEVYEKYIYIGKWVDGNLVVESWLYEETNEEDIT